MGPLQVLFSCSGVLFSCYSKGRFPGCKYFTPPFTLQITLAEYVVVSRSGFASTYPAFREPSIVKDYHKKNASTIIG